MDEPATAQVIAFEPRPATARRLLEQILAAVRFELVCPNTFDFERCEKLLVDALKDKP